MTFYESMEDSSEVLPSKFSQMGSIGYVKDLGDSAYL